jgi:hypothetical protein
MGRKERTWQDTAYVLNFFSQDIKAYHSYIESGIHQGRREDLSGGGFLRSFGGWSEIKHQRQRVKEDQRILDESGFVMKILAEAGENYKRKSLLKRQGYILEKLAEKISVIYNINQKDILFKGRHIIRVEARSFFCYLAVHYLSTSVTDIARLLGMAPSAISYAVTRGKGVAEERGLQLIDEILNN